MLRIMSWLAILPLAGCAFIDVTVHPPKGPISSEVRGGQGREVVIGFPFRDNRPTAERCGMLKNGYNMDTADVLCAADPQVVIADLLRKELVEAGFSVPREVASEDHLHIDGTLLQFFVEPKIDAFTVDMETDIHVRLVVRSGSGLVAERDFYVKGQRTVFLGTPNEFQVVADLATRQVIKDMVSAIVSLSDRYPEVTSSEPEPAQAATDLVQENQS